MLPQTMVAHAETKGQTASLGSVVPQAGLSVPSNESVEGDRGRPPGDSSETLVGIFR